jgi:hypothetical protein
MTCFSVFCAMLWSFGGSLLATVCSVACFSSFRLHVLLQRILSLWNFYTEKSGGMRSGDEGSQMPCWTKQTQRTLAVKQLLCPQCGQSPHSVCCASLLKDFHGNWASVSPVSPIKLPDATHAAYHEHFLCFKILLPVSALSFYSVLPSQGMHC